MPPHFIRCGSNGSGWSEFSTVTGLHASATRVMRQSDRTLPNSRVARNPGGTPKPRSRLRDNPALERVVRHWGEGSGFACRSGLTLARKLSWKDAAESFHTSDEADTRHFFLPELHGHDTISKLKPKWKVRLKCFSHETH
jgi:hypothetical protein